MPYSVEYRADTPFTITTKELGTKQEDPGEYFASHGFTLKKTGVTGDLSYIAYRDAEPTYAYEGDLGKKVEVNTKLLSLESKKDSDKPSFMWLLTLPILGGELSLPSRKKTAKNLLKRVPGK